MASHYKTSIEYYHTGWIPTIRKEKISLDLESFPLEIKTTSELGSRAHFKLSFYSVQGANAGTILIWFTDPAQYQLLGCTKNKIWTKFPTNFPSALDRVWRITLTRSSGTKAVVIHCNEVELVNTQLSESACVNTDWSSVWNTDVAQIQFSPHDTVSDSYRLGK